MSAPIPPRPTSYTLPPTLLHDAESYVLPFMAQNDASHDDAHIRRVHQLATHLTTAHPSSSTLNGDLIALSALLHDIADKKYSATEAPESWLLKHDCPEAVAKAVQVITENVSYSHEMAQPERVAQVLSVYPELGVVQDADRLDALGAVGIARCFTFGGAKRREGGLEACMEHLADKLKRLAGMMKTVEGKRLAEERERRVVEFEKWWKMEVGGCV